MAGNLLIKDRDDVFFMPQTIHDYNRMVTFDFGSSMGIGNGGLVFGAGESAVLGVFAHKTDFIGAIPTAFAASGDGSIMNSSGSNDFGGNFLPFTSTGVLGSPYMAPMNWVDVIIGFGSEEMPWGIRASLGSAADKSEVAGGSTNDNNSIAFNVVAGTTFNEDVEVSAEFSFASATIEATPGGSKDEVSPFHFAASVRKTASEEQEALQLGYLGSFYFATGTDKNTPPSPGTVTEADLSAFGITLGAGPVYTPHERTTVAMYGTFEYQNITSKSGSAEDKGSRITIPGVNIATEVELSSWAQARAGLKSKYMLDTLESPGTGGQDKDTSRGLVYNWYTGVGITIDNFMLDGYFDPSVITSGTDLLGNSSDLFGMVTATFMF
jgi:hypothetical protein